MQRMERRGLCRGWREEDGAEEVGEKRVERGWREGGRAEGGGGGGGGKEHYKLSGDW